MLAAEFAAFAPATGTVLIGLTLPDRRAMLDRFDDLAAGPEGGVTMRAADGDHHGDVGDRAIAELSNAGKSM
jgi:hypothetical protein